MESWIIDTDAGVDDAQAILYALKSENVQIDGITCVAGNVSLDLVLANVEEVLRVAGRQDIPIFRGASRPLVNRLNTAKEFHGPDGLGGYWEQAGKVQEYSQIQQESAIDFLMRQSEEKDGINLITLGPLTNLAIALLAKPYLKIRKLVVMGGTSFATGNVRPTAEFNVHADPEAFHITLERVPFLTLVTWETCYKNKFNHSWIMNWIEGESDIKVLLQRMCKFRMENLPFTLICDLMAVACALDESVILESEDRYVEIELGGGITRGQLVVYRTDTLQTPSANVRIVNELNLDRIKEKMQLIN